MTGARDKVPARLTATETRKLADDLAAVLDRIRTGELLASTAMTYRLEGALTALQAVLGNRNSLLTDLNDEARMNPPRA